MHTLSELMTMLHSLTPQRPMSRQMQDDFIEYGSACLPYLIPLLQSDLTYASVEAAALLGAIGDPSVIPLLRSLIDSPNEDVQIESLVALVQLRDPDHGWYIHALDHPSWLRRFSACIILGGFCAIEALPQIRMVCQDIQPEVRRIAAITLAILDDPEAFRYLEPLCTDSDPMVRATTFQALERLREPRGLALARVALEDSNQRVRESAQVYGQAFDLPGLDLED